jgi:hypothetical protein
MKKHLLFTSFLILVTLISHAQWQPDVRLTNNPSPSNTSLNNAWCVAASGDSVLAVWDDQRDGNYEIYYKRSTDAGVSWGEDTRLTNSAYSYDPCISISGLIVHVVWQELVDGHYEMYYKRSTDGGVSWDADTRLTTTTSDSWNPSIAVNGSAVHVVWEDERQGNSEIYYKGSTDGGVTWGVDTRLSNDPANSWNPSVAVSGSVVHVAWYDDRNGAGNWEIYYKRSTDGGLSWGDETRMTNNSHVSRYPCIAVSGSVIHLVWHDDRDGNYDIYYKRSTDGGITWSADTRLTTDPGNALFPCVAVSGTTVHVVWIDPRDTPNVEIYYKRSTDGGLSWETDEKLSNSFLSTYPSVAVSGSVIHVVWQDLRDGNYEIYYKRNPSNSEVGLKELSSSNMKFTVFPNPASAEIKVRSLENINELSITDIYGKEIYHSKILNPTTELLIPTSDFTSGIYIIKVKKGGKESVQKIIKQ